MTLIELLSALKREFLPDLEVSDDGGYWETRDLAELVRRRSLTQAAIDGLAEGLRRHGISREAAEDPDILLRHVERVAEHVHRILHRPAEHPPVVAEDDDDFSGKVDPEATERMWDQLAKHDRRQQERLLRHRGTPEPWCRHGNSPAGRDPGTRPRRARRGSRRVRWRRGSMMSQRRSMKRSTATFPVRALVLPALDDDSFEAEEEERHPLLQRATDLLIRMDEIFCDAASSLAAPLDTLFQGVGDTVGGLAQALSDRDHDADDYGLRVVQLKRALRGAAFARGALFPLRSTMSKAHFDELFSTLKQMETDIVTELGKVRSEYRGEDA